MSATSDHPLPAGAPLPEAALPEPLTAAELHEYAEMMRVDGWATDLVDRAHATAAEIERLRELPRLRPARIFGGYDGATLFDPDDVSSVLVGADGTDGLIVWIEETSGG